MVTSITAMEVTSLGFAFRNRYWKWFVVTILGPCAQKECGSCQELLLKGTPRSYIARPSNRSFWMDELLVDENALHSTLFILPLDEPYGRD